MSNIFEMNRQPKSAKAMPIHEFSEEKLALDFVNRHQHEVRFIGDLNEWFIYDGTCWRRDRRRQIFDWSREVCRVAGAAALGNKRTEQFARALTSAKTRYAVTSLASDDQRISMLSSEFDADPLLLGTPGGVVDLRTGILRESQPEDFITKKTAVSPAPAGTFAKEWQRFLEKTFPLRDNSGPDHELIAFLQRWAGYCLTGLTTEQKFADEYGTGRNGKNAMTDQWFGILNDYAVRLPSEVLMQRPVEPHRAELMPLRGARLIIANEIRKGARWNQSRLMEISGGDMLTANPMRADPVTFPVTGKLIVLGNHKPKFESHNAAAIQRLLLLEFRMQFVDPDGAPPSPDLPSERIAVRDNGLAARLRDEWPAILRWMIDGCLEWQCSGLKPPLQVIADSAETIQSDDLLVQWRLDPERCEDVTPGAKGRDLISLCNRSYNDFCTTRGERTASYSAFATMLRDHDVEKAKTNTGMVPLGFQLTPAERSRLTRSEELL